MGGGSVPQLSVPVPLCLCLPIALVPVSNSLNTLPLCVRACACAQLPTLAAPCVARRRSSVLSRTNRTHVHILGLQVHCSKWAIARLCIMGMHGYIWSAWNQERDVARSGRIYGPH